MTTKFQTRLIRAARFAGTNTSNVLLVLGILSVLSPAAVAQGAIGVGGVIVDTTQWKCTSCPFKGGVSGTVDVGAASVSEKSDKFGEFTGLNKKGIYAIGDASIRSRQKNADYWQINASNLGLDSRSVDAEGGKQGQYKLLFHYDELPHYVSDAARTPFSGSGGTSLTLPAGFAAATTGAMPLATTLQTVDIGTQRKRLCVGLSWMPSSRWEYALKFRHETKDGTQPMGASFFVNTAQLVAPVDYVTDQVDASATYTGKKLQMKFAYYGSTFRDGNSALTWQDPYTPIVGETAGQLALPPDNQFHQFQAAGGYQLSDKTRLSGDIAYGRMTQNDSFLAYTQNPNLLMPNGALGMANPGGSLNGRVATLDAGLKLYSALTQRLRLNVAYTHNARDNQTPQATYQTFITDMFTNAAVTRTNLPYSFKEDKLKLSANYMASAKWRGSVGADFDAHRRTFQEVDTTRENTVWGKISSHVSKKLDLTLKLTHGKRSNSGYHAVADIALENPLMRKFYLANRTRDTASARADIAVNERISVELGVDSSEDKYSDSTVGLQDGKEFSLNGDVSAMLTDRTSLHFFANHQEIKSKQAGSDNQSYPLPDWSANNKDTIDFFGLGVKHTAIPDKLDLGADYSITHSRSQINVDNGASGSGFPDMKTSFDSLKLYATYSMKKNMSLQAGYWYQHYTSRDWMLDGVAPATIPNVLALGLQAPQYKVNVVRVSLRYKF